MLALVALAAAPPPARGADLGARADLTYADDSYNGTQSESLRQTYLLDYKRHVSTVTSYRLSLRFQDDRATTNIPGPFGKLHSRVIEPLGSVDHRLEDFGVSMNARRYDEEIEDRSGVPFTRLMERYGGFAYVRPFERGEVTLGVDRLAFESSSEASESRTRDDRMALGFRYISEDLQITNENRLQFFEDTVTGLSRINMGPRLSAFYSRSAGTRSLSGTYVLDYLRTEQRAQADTALTEIQPAAGLLGLDDLPLETDPLASTPALIDRIFDASAGVALGPDGESFQNIGVDADSIAPVEELRIHVRRADGTPVPFGGPISWSVYSSLDGLRWGAVDGAIVTFSTATSAYIVTFPPESNRFFKVVNFGVNTVETYVTEVQAFWRETVRPNQLRVSSAVRQVLTLVAAGRPLPRLALTAAVRGAADTVSFQGTRRWATDASSNLGARAGPFGPVAVTANHILGYAQEETGTTRLSNTIGAGVQYVPIERFDLRLDGRRTDDQVDQPRLGISSRATTSTLRLGTRLEPYPTVRANASVGSTLQQVDGHRSSQYLLANGGLDLDLHRDVRFGLAANVERRLGDAPPEARPDALAFIAVAPHEVYTAELEYRGGAQLRLLARVGYAIGEVEEGIVQQYRVSWSPFPDGAVQLFMAWVEDVDPLSGLSVRRVTLAPFWQVNRHTALQLSYNMVRGWGSQPTRQENLTLTLTVRL